MEVAGARVAFGCGAGGVIGAPGASRPSRRWPSGRRACPTARLVPFRLDATRTPTGISVGGMPVRERAETPGERTVAVLLADPYSFPVQGFVEQSREALGGMELVGGLAGSPGGGGTRLLLDGRVVERGAVGVVVSGPVELRTLVSQGCRPVGSPMTVTAADGPHLQELAGVPAYRKLEELLRDLPEGERDLVARGLHLGVAMDEYADAHGRGDFLVRGVVGADPGAGTLTVGDVVEVGRTVQFQVRDAASAGEDLDALTARHRADGPTGGALLFSCNGRGSAMFGADGAAHDARALRRGLDSPSVAGFFAGGEIGRVGGRNHLHGFTASVLTFGP